MKPVVMFFLLSALAKVTILLCFLALTACGQTTTLSVSPLPQGPKGDKGDKGDQGIPGLNGVSCNVSPIVGGAIVACTDGTAAYIADGAKGDKGDTGDAGQDGQNGQDGAPAPVNPYAITSVIDPCGDQAGFDEVLLKLANGTILAHYSDGAKQFLVTIGTGNYVTTDGNACYFSVHNDGSVTW